MSLKSVFQIFKTLFQTGDITGFELVVPNLQIAKRFGSLRGVLAFFLKIVNR